MLQNLLFALSLTGCIGVSSLNDYHYHNTNTNNQVAFTQRSQFDNIIQLDNNNYIQIVSGVDYSFKVSGAMTTINFNYYNLGDNADNTLFTFIDSSGNGEFVTTNFCRFVHKVSSTSYYGCSFVLSGIDFNNGDLLPYYNYRCYEYSTLNDALNDTNHINKGFDVDNYLKEHFLYTIDSHFSWFNTTIEQIDSYYDSGINQSHYFIYNNSLIYALGFVPLTDSNVNGGYIPSYDFYEEPRRTTCVSLNISVSISDTDLTQVYDNGYQNGYTNGYNDGLEEDNLNLLSLFFTIADTPILMLRSLFNFDLFGLSLFALITGVITALIVIWVVRKLI